MSLEILKSDDFSAEISNILKFSKSKNPKSYFGAVLQNGSAVLGPARQDALIISKHDWNDSGTKPEAIEILKKSIENRNF